MNTSQINASQINASQMESNIVDIDSLKIDFESLAHKAREYLKERQIDDENNSIAAALIVHWYSKILETMCTPYTSLTSRSDADVTSAVVSEVQNESSQSTVMSSSDQETDDQETDDLETDAQETDTQAAHVPAHVLYGPYVTLTFRNDNYWDRFDDN